MMRSYTVPLRHTAVIRGLLALLLAPGCAPDAVVWSDAPPPSTLAHAWAREEPGFVTPAVVLPGPQPRALLRVNGPVIGSGWVVVERVGDTLVTTPAPLPAEGGASVVVGDATGDGVPDLIVRTERAVRVWDPVSWTELAALLLPSERGETPLGAWPVAADLDSEPELVVPSRWGVGVYDLSGALVRYLPTLEAPRVGQLDADAAPELLYPNAQVALDGATLEGERLRLNLLGYLGGLRDVDGDGLDELEMAASGEVSFWDPRRGGWVLQSHVGALGAHGPALLADAHGDGTLDLWLPVGQGPRFLLLDPQTGLVHDAVARPSPTMWYGEAIAWDSDGDGLDEVLYAGNGWLGLVDPVSLRWVTAQEEGGAGELLLADLGQGEELVECAGSALLVRDPDTAELRRRVPLPDSGGARCAAGDVDGDGDAEIAVAGALGLTVYDLAGDVARELSSYPGAARGVAMEDADGDGLADLAWLGGELCYAPRASGVAWCAATESVGEVRMGDLDGDGVAEVVTAGNGRRTQIWSASGVRVAVVPAGAEDIELATWGGRTFLVTSLRTGGGVDVTAWRLGRGGVAPVLSHHIPWLNGVSLRVAGSVAWVAGWDGIASLDLLSGATRLEELRFVDLRRGGVVRPTEVLAHVSDGWVAWSR
jgi:hypothetical protein